MKAKCKNLFCGSFSLAEVIIEADDIQIVEEKPKAIEIKDWDFGICEDGKIGIAIPTDGGRNWILDHPFIPIGNLAALIAEMQKAKDGKTDAFRFAAQLLMLARDDK